MPQWAGSCWYYLRFIDPHNDKVFAGSAKVKHWLPVDLYVGGAEHAVLHLLYSRFWHKVLYDPGHVPTPEPFQKLVNEGLILGETEYTGFSRTPPEWVSAGTADATAKDVFLVRVPESRVMTKCSPPTLKEHPGVTVTVDEDGFYFGHQRVTSW